MREVKTRLPIDTVELIRVAFPHTPVAEVLRQGVEQIIIARARMVGELFAGSYGKASRVRKHQRHRPRKVPINSVVKRK